MIQRCTDKNYHAFSLYGGRGIAVCERWRERDGQGFANFFADMGHRPSLAHTIERIDNSLGYEAANCRWATRTDQARNRRTNHLLTFNGETKSIAEWAEHLGVPSSRLYNRVLRCGYTAEETLRLPLYGKKLKHLERKVDHGRSDHS